MWRDLARICAADGLPLRSPSRFPRNGLLAARVALLGGEEPWMPRFVRAVYHANFVDDREISEPEVIGSLLEELGLDGRALLAAAQSPGNKEQIGRAAWGGR